jgi:hypothetical protein
MPRPAHHAPEHQALVVNLPGGAANRLLHADRGRFQGAILGLMWLELLSVSVRYSSRCFVLGQCSQELDLPLIQSPELESLHGHFCPSPKKVKLAKYFI